MTLQVRRAHPLDVREDVVEMFWKLQTWPFATKEDYFRNWDWRTASMSESEPAVWLARDRGEVVGHIVANFRHLRIAGHPVRAGILANFRLESNKNPMTPVLLAKATRTLVHTGEIDMLLGYGNEPAHSMFVGLGSHNLGAMRSYAHIRQWAPILARRIPVGAPLTAMLSQAERAMKSSGRRRAADGQGGHIARSLSVDETLAMDRSHWSSSDSFVSECRPGYLANRFLRCPFRACEVFGVTDQRTGQLQGLVVTEGTRRVNVLQCTVNEGAISEAQAVELAMDAIPTAESIIVPLLPQSSLTSDFLAAGYSRRSRPLEAASIKNTAWSAYWRATHPLASLFGETKRWKVWSEWNNH
jgi:hypothetical protein